MIGKEVADALAPFAMWGAIVLGVIALIALLRWWIRRGAKKEERLDVVLEGERQEDDTRKELQEETDAMRERLRARRRRPGGVPHH